MAAPQVSLLLCDLESPINIGQILRTADVFGLRVFIADGKQVLRDPAKRRIVEDFSCGALARTDPIVLGMEQVDRLLTSLGGRKIATTLGDGAKDLSRFRFRPDDLVVLGNEYRGVEASVVERCQEKLVIPMPGGSKPKPSSWSPISPVQGVTDNGAPCLNVAAAAAIISFACFEQSASDAFQPRDRSPRGAIAL